MSDVIDHGELSESLSAYALGALPDEESARMREHLASCRECRAELEWLRAAVDALPASVPQVEAPEELKQRVMAAVDSEASLLRAAGESADRPERPARRRWWPSVTALSPAGMIVGACAATVVIGGVYLALNQGPINEFTTTRMVHVQVTGPERAAGAHAALRVHGSRAELLIAKLPAPPADHVDEVWVQRGTAAPVPAGTFVVRYGSVVVSRPVHRGDHVLVTVERGRGTTAPTTTPFFVAKA